MIKVHTYKNLWKVLLRFVKYALSGFAKNALYRNGPLYAIDSVVTNLCSFHFFKAYLFSFCFLCKWNYTVYYMKK